MNISFIAMANKSDMKQTNVHINDEKDVFFLVVYLCIQRRKINYFFLWNIFHAKYACLFSINGRR